MRSEFWFLILALAIPSKALACSPTTGYRVPTNIELLEEADLVVLAAVSPGPSRCEKYGNRDFCLPTVILEPKKVLKGKAPQALTAEGGTRNRRGDPYPPSPTSLSEPNPSSLWGACIRQSYSEQALVVAMFSENDGEPQQLGHPFARAVEDVEDADALWVRAAELYIGVLSANAPAERRAAFLRERDRLVALTTDPEAQAIAADITAYLEATAHD